VGPTHSTTPGPHSTPKRERGVRKGVPFPNHIGVWGALYMLLIGKNTSLKMRISEVSIDRYSQNDVSIID